MSFSNLYWRMGFGWPNVIIFVLFIASAIYFDGWLKWISVALSAFTLLLLFIRYNRWNGSNWRKVHSRAMLIYAGLVGEEMALSKNEGRNFDISEPCRKLAYRLVGYGKQAEADALVNYLLMAEGGYLSSLIEDHLQEIHPELNEHDIESLKNVTDQLEFGPELVIANIIENTFGREEATRYTIAMLKKEAS